MHAVVAAKGLLSAEHARIVQPTLELVQDITQLLRLCYEGPFEASKAPEGLKQALAAAGREPTFEALEARLRDSLTETAALFDIVVS